MLPGVMAAEALLEAVLIGDCRLLEDRDCQGVTSHKHAHC
jgi:hypothetical protein